MMISNNSVKRMKKMPRGTFLAFFETQKWTHMCLLVAMLFTIPIMAFFSMRFLLLNVFPTLWNFYYPLATPTNLFLLLNLIIFTLFAMSHSPQHTPAAAPRPAIARVPSAATMANDDDADDDNADDDDNGMPIHPPSPSPSPMPSIPYLHLPSSPSPSLNLNLNLNLMPTPSQSSSASAPSPPSVALASPAMHSGDQYYRRLFDHHVAENYMVASPVRYLSFEDADMLLGVGSAASPPPASILASSGHKVRVSTSTAIDRDDDDDGDDGDDDDGGRRDGVDVDEDARDLIKSGAYNSRKGKDLTLIMKKRRGSERHAPDRQDEGSSDVTGSDRSSSSYYKGYKESMESSEGSSPLVVNEGGGGEVDEAEAEDEREEVRHGHGSLVSHHSAGGGGAERPLASSHFTHRSSTSKSGFGHSPLRAHNSRGRANAKRPGQSLEATWRAICEEKKKISMGSPLKNNNSRRAIILQRAERSSGSSGSVIISSPTSVKAKPRREPSMRADELHSRIDAFISRFNDQIRIQREQSILNYMEMVGRGA